MIKEEIKQDPPPLTEPAGNARRSKPTAKLMEQPSTAVGFGSVAFPSEPVKGQSPASGVACMPPAYSWEWVVHRTEGYFVLIFIQVRFRKLENESTRNLNRIFTGMPEASNCAGFCQGKQANHP